MHDPLSEAKREADLTDDGSDESDVFIYPGAEPVAEAEEEDEEEEDFRYPGVDEPTVPAPSAPVPEATAQTIPVAPREPSPVVSPLNEPTKEDSAAARSAATTPEEPPVRSRAPEPTRAQLESLYAGASAGDLDGFQKLVNDVAKASECEPFALVNDATSRTGLTPLHAAASRGHLDIVKWRA